MVGLIFESIKKWDNYLLQWDKYVWLKFIGVLIHILGEDSFWRLVNLFGHVLLIYTWYYCSWVVCLYSGVKVLVYFPWLVGEVVWVVVGCILFFMTTKEEYEETFVVGSGKLSASFSTSVDVSFVEGALGFDDGSQDREC